MSKNRLEMNELLDLYGRLLTKKQQLFCSDYFCHDLSLSEIAENEGISRSAVFEVIQRSEKELLRLESILCERQKQSQRMAIYEKMKQTNDIQLMHNYIEQVQKI